MKFLAEESYHVYNQGNNRTFNNNETRVDIISTLVS